MFMIKIKNKKAISLWISFVLLTAFVVLISAFMYDWMTGFTKETTISIKKRTENTELCNLVSVSIDEACLNISTTPKSLYINITNRNDLRVRQLIFRLYKDFKSTEIETTEINVTIKPQFKKELVINTTLSNVSYLDVIPATIKEETLHVCTDRKAVIESVSSC